MDPRTQNDTPNDKAVPNGDNAGHAGNNEENIAQAHRTAYREEWLSQLKDNLDALAKGDLTFNPVLKEGDRYTQVIHEQFAPINASLVGARDAIKKLVNDTNMLSKAAVEGKLSTRADASKHQGDYQKVVQGVNDTLDSIIGPLNETMRIADSYASGDLTARVSIDTQGDFAEFATSLDAIGENLESLLRQVNGSIDVVSSTSQELATSTEEMNASTEQVSSSIQHISKGAQTQAAQVDETAKIMAEMAKAMNKAVDEAKVASNGAQKARDMANNGKISVNSTISKMTEIDGVVKESAQVIESLGKRSEEIGQIVDVITNISDQTNMLALNAAIEAARAGEQGRGFAVVAEEVKNLAEDSREAAERIAKMIKEVQLETNKAVEAMHRGTKTAAEGMQMVNDTGKMFQEIDGMTNEFLKMMSGLTSFVELQKNETQRAARSVDSIASIAEETASSSEESASSTEELTASMEDMTARVQSLSEMASDLQKVAGQFKIGGAVEMIAPTQAPKLKVVAKPTAKGVSHKIYAPKIPLKVKQALSKRGIETQSE